MNYEKAYKDALERMKSWARGEHPECFTEAQKAAEFIFPELAESEDERIRKKLIKYFQDLKGGWFGNISHDDILAWLEKQAPKPMWSDEDSLMIDSIIDTMKWLEGKGATNMKIDWLKSLKKRMGV